MFFVFFSRLAQALYVLCTSTMYCIFFRRLRRPKYLRTVIEGGGQGGTTVAEQKKNKYNMLKLAALPHQPIGTEGNFIRKLKAKQKNVNLPRNPKP